MAPTVPTLVVAAEANILVKSGGPGAETWDMADHPPIDTQWQVRQQVVRPMWNPVEEARARAEMAQRAALAADAPASKSRRRGAGQPVAGGPGQFGPGGFAGAGFADGPAAASPGRRTAATLFHTTTPRLIVSLTPLLMAAVVGFLAWLHSRGYIVTRSDGGSPASAREFGAYRIDPSIASAAVLAAIIGLAVPVLSWNWWVIAATLNARTKSRHCGSPCLAPVSFVIAVAAAVARGALPSQLEKAGVALDVVGVVAWVISCYGVLFSVRSSARAIKAEPRHWTTLIWLPWVSALLSSGLLIVGRMAQSVPVVVVALLVPSGLWLWGWATLCLGMAEFDRACRASDAGTSDPTALPAFLMSAIGNR
ncbi:MAG: hypothetical protein WCC60_06880 [Ilumatobacteraceae bacterium]